MTIKNTFLKAIKVQKEIDTELSITNDKMQAFSKEYRQAFDNFTSQHDAIIAEAKHLAFVDKKAFKEFLGQDSYINAKGELKRIQALRKQEFFNSSGRNFDKERGEIDTVKNDLHNMSVINKQIMQNLLQSVLEYNINALIKKGVKTPIHYKRYLDALAKEIDIDGVSISILNGNTRTPDIKIHYNKDDINISYSLTVYSGTRAILELVTVKHPQYRTFKQLNKIVHDAKKYNQKIIQLKNKIYEMQSKVDQTTFLKFDCLYLNY